MLSLSLFAVLISDVVLRLVPALGQVIEGESEVVSIRDADGRLEPLIFTLVGLGVVTILGTVLFWWFTRPKGRTG